MSTLDNIHTVNDAFFQPLAGLAAASSAARPCPELSDENWVRLGLQRVLESATSGRGFLQEHGPRFESSPKTSNYFASLQSARRLEVLRDVNGALLTASPFADRLAELPELLDYERFALDGHWHQAATHDPRHEGVKMAAGHCYSLNLRGHQLRQLTAAEGLHEHDMSMRKRLKPAGLRQGAPQGRRVIIVYDKAGIDFAYWKRCRHERALYFLSRPKEGMVFGWLESRAMDRTDARNAGVTHDDAVLTREGHSLRLIHYVEPGTGAKYEFLTNEPDLPPGVPVELYRRRWDIEKVFDEIKNKLQERKAWGTTLVARSAQGQFVALAHNLLLLYEQRLEQEHGVSNAAEDKRRARRQSELAGKAGLMGRAVPTLILTARGVTQRSVKLIRWLCHAIRERLAEEVALPRLRQLYAHL
jgi:DDE family transposase